MRAPLWLAVMALHGLGAWLFLGSWQQGRDLQLPGIPLRGADLAGRLQEAEVAEPPALFDEAGELQLAALSVPEYDPPELREDESPWDLGRFPESVAALDGQEVLVQGYPLPYESGPAGTTAVLLSKNPPGCCFGSRPALDEWIEVRAPGAPWQSLDPGTLTRFRGVLRVGEVLDDTGFALSLYRLEGGQPEGR